jgi:ATP-binding cassette subfamily B multidrug efflux pump
MRKEEKQADSVQNEFKLKNNRMQFGRLMSYFRPFIPLLVVGLVLAVLLNLVVLAKPYIMKIIIDNYLVPQVADFKALAIYGAVYYVLMLGGSVASYGQNYLLTYIGQKIMHNIRMQLFTHIQKMSMTFFDRNSSGRILTRLTNDVEALNEIYSGLVVSLFKDSVLVVGILVTMFIMDARLALVSMICVPFIILATVFYRIS